jgi:hypothetical protein
VPTHKVDHLLEQLIVMADAAADDDALPRLRAQGRGDDGLHVVAAIEADQAEISANATLHEPGPSDLNAVCDRLGVPRSWHPIWIEPDHEHPRCEIRSRHSCRLLRAVGRSRFRNDHRHSVL